MHLYILHFSKPGKPRSPNWLNHICRRAVCLKNSAYPRWHRSSNQTSRNRFMQSRNRCPLTTQRAKERFVLYKAEHLATSATGSQSFRYHTKPISRNLCTTNFPPIRNSSGSPPRNILDTAEISASRFALNSSLCQPLPAFSCFSHAFVSVIIIRKIRKVLSSLNVSKPSGSDCIPLIALKMRFRVSSILRHLCFLSLNRNTFSSLWRDAGIFLIPKHGYHSDPNNHHPITFTSVISKVLKPPSPTDFIHSLNGLLSDRQYRLHPHRSTDDLLVVISNS